MRKKEIGISFILLLTVMCSLFLSIQLKQVSASIAASTSLTPPTPYADVYIAEQALTGYFYSGPNYVGW